MKRLFVIFVTFFTPFTVSAANTAEWLRPFIYDDNPWSLTRARHSAELYDCGLEHEDQWFCSDGVYYYNVRVEGKLQVVNGVLSRLELTVPFSVTSYSGLILNLRKDGYTLSHLTVDGTEYDVEKKMKSGEGSQVNREVVLLLNRGELSSSRALLWQKSGSEKKRSAHLTSNGIVLKVSFFASDSF